MRQGILRLIDPLRRRIYMMLSRAALTRLNDDDGRQYGQLTVLKGETKDNVERLQEYGFTSVAKAGAQVLMACVAGNRDHPLIIKADDPRYRKHGLSEGEVAMYDALGKYIYFKNDGTIEINCTQLLIKASEEVRIESPDTKATGDIYDLCDTINESVNNFRHTYNLHTHNENNNLGGPTDVPNQEVPEV